VTVDERISDDFTDYGQDVLGGSDSIAQSTDSYTWAKNQGEFLGVIDLGTTDSPYSISAIGSDNYGYYDHGSSTLSGGLEQSNDCYSFGESSGNNSTLSVGDGTSAANAATMASDADFYATGGCDGKCVTRDGRDHRSRRLDGTRPSVGRLGGQGDAQCRPSRIEPRHF
jgi:hypothetical protein